MENPCDCSADISARALHFVFKVSNRTLTTKFYREILGMKVLRHEEFTEGCDAACNGPYDNRWSKTMVGYGPEDSHFVIELTYNYGVDSYEQGNDFQGMTIVSKESVDRAQQHGWPMKDLNGLFVVEAPGGYKIFLINKPQPSDKDPVQKVTLASSDITRSIKYWKNILGLKLFSQTEKAIVLGYSESQAKLEFIDIGEEVNHAKAYGRIAFACPLAQQPTINNRVEAVNGKILTPLITLDTPGKATVRVIILADPDGHEICFVDEEGFTQLSAFDEEGNNLLDKYIAKDPFETGKV